MGKKLLIKFPYESTFGGGEKHTLTLIDELPFEWVALTNCSALMPELRKRNIPIHTPWMPREPVTLVALILFSFLMPYVVVRLWHALARLRNLEDIDAIYCLSLTEKVILTPWAWLLGLKIVWVEHAPIGRWLRWNPWRLWYVLWSGFVTIVAVSDFVGEQLRDFGDVGSSLQVIPNGIDERFFDVEPTRYADEPFRLLYVGRLDEQKGIFDLLEALKALPDMQLRIVGDGPDRERVEEVAKQFGNRVECVGYSEDVAAEYAQAHCVVVPSHEEAFGLVAAEAIASNTPVVAARVGGLIDIVSYQHWFFAPGKPEECVEVIQSMHTQYDHALEQCTVQKKQIHERCSQSRMVSEYKKVLE